VGVKEGIIIADRAASLPRCRWWIPLTIIVVAALIATVLINDRGSGDSSTTTGAAGESGSGAGPEPNVVVTEVEDPEQAEVDTSGSEKGDDPLADGPTDAPVTLVVFSDYQRRFCAVWSQDTLPKMLDYVDSGDLRIE
jgi:protein-disulfide isomerase